MALKATIFKAELNVVDMDRHYYQTHSLTLAQHPSETNERLMVRLLAFALHAHEHLLFTKGLSTEDEPDLWQKSLSDEIELWIDLGTPDEKRIRKACGRAKKVQLYTYQPKSAAVWFKQNQAFLQRFENLEIRHLSADTVQSLGELAERNMDMQCMIQDGQVQLSVAEKSVAVTFLSFTD